MPDINLTLDQLLERYAQTFKASTHSALTRNELRASIPANVSGVYVIAKKADALRPIYIGSSGKIGRGLQPSDSSIHSRIFGASTPYKFDELVFRFGPTTT